MIEVVINLVYVFGNRYRQGTYTPGWVAGMSSSVICEQAEGVSASQISS